MKFGTTADVPSRESAIDLCSAAAMKVTDPQLDFPNIIP